MGLLDFIFRRGPSKAEQAERMLDYGGFLARLNHHADRLGGGREQPFELRLSLFLIFAAGCVRERNGMAELSRATTLNEAIAMNILLTQGAHTLADRYFQERARGEEAKLAVSRIVLFILAKAFGLDDTDLDNDPFALKVMGMTGAAMRQSRQLVPGLLDRVAESWDAFFRDDAALDDLVRAYLATCDYADHFMRPAPAA
jgi:hypothetical protein